LHGLLWALKKSKMDVMLQAANKLMPSSSKKKKPCPYTPTFILAVQSQLNLNNVTDCLVTRRKSITFDKKAKVGALVQRACTFEKQKLAEEAEDEALAEQLALARAVSTRQYAVVQCTGSVTGRMKTT
jgi:hypothetical protein